MGPEERPGIVLQIPPNALAEDTTISIQELSSEDLPEGVAELAPIGRGYRLGPDGLQLAAPATVTLASDAQELATLDLNSGAPAFSGLLLSSDRTIDFLRNSVTTSNLARGSVTLTGETTHLTDVVRISGPLKVKLDPDTMGPPISDKAWNAAVTVTNLSSESLVDVKKIGYLAEGAVELVGDGSAFDLELAPGESEAASPAPKFACRAAGAGTYAVTTNWKAPHHESALAASLLMNGFLIPSGAIEHGAGGTLVVSGVAECTEPPREAPQPMVSDGPNDPVACDTGAPIAATLPPGSDLGGFEITVGDSTTTFTALFPAGGFDDAFSQGAVEFLTFVINDPSAPLPTEAHSSFDAQGNLNINLALNPSTGEPFFYAWDARNERREYVFDPTVPGGWRIESNSASIEVDNAHLPRGPFEVAARVTTPVGCDDTDAADVVIPEGTDSARGAGSIFTPPSMAIAIDVPMEATIPTGLDFSNFDGPVHVIPGDLNCDRQPELYAVTGLGAWSAFDPGGPPNAQPVTEFRTAPGARPLVGDWDGDGCDEPAAVFDQGTLVIFYDHVGDPADRFFFARDNGDVPFMQPGARPIAGDFDGDGVDDLGALLPGTLAVAPLERPLFDDLALITDPDLVVTFKNGPRLASPLYRSNGPGPEPGERTLLDDDYIIVQWGDAAFFGCATLDDGTDRCVTSLQLKWWPHTGLIVFVYPDPESDVDDLWACPANALGAIENTIAECSRLPDVAGFMESAVGR